MCHLFNGWSFIEASAPQHKKKGRNSSSEAHRLRKAMVMQSVLWVCAFALFPQLLCCCVCCMQLLVSIRLHGVESMTTQTTVRDCYGNKFCQYIVNVSACTLICHLMYSCMCAACLKDQPSCGCCLMQKKMMRMESFFNQTYEAMTKYLAKPKMALDDMMSEQRIRKSHKHHQNILKNKTDPLFFIPFA